MTTPTSSESWVEPIFDAVVSEYQRSGYFDKVNSHEPRRKPSKGLTAAVWLQSVRPLPQRSGVDSTSGILTFTGRSYMNMFKEPNDMIDVWMMRANAHLMRLMHDDFDFGGVISNVDLLGAFGTPLSLLSGYLDQDATKYRIMDLTIPCVVNDIWPQVN